MLMNHSWEISKASLYLPDIGIVNYENSVEIPACNLPRGGNVCDPYTIENDIFHSSTFNNNPLDNCSLEAEKENRMGFCSLPEELKLKIFSYFSPRDLCHKLCLVCKDWLRLCFDPMLWKRISIKRISKMYHNEENMRKIFNRMPLLKEIVMEGIENVDVVLNSVALECSQLELVEARFSSGLASESLELLLMNCPKLFEFDIEGTRLNDSNCLKLLSNFNLLQRLNLSHCLHLEDHILIDISENCELLEELNIDGIAHITDSSVQYLIQKRCKTLKKLLLDGEHLTDDSYCELAKCEKLKILGISFAYQLNNAGLIAISKIKNLTWLQIRRGVEISSKSFDTFFQKADLSQLLYLNLSECNHITNKNLKELVKKCRGLHFLALNWCLEISDCGINAVISSCKELKALHLIGLHSLTGCSFINVGKRVPNLEFLTLEQCSSVDDSLIERETLKSPHLKIIDYYGSVVVSKPREVENWLKL